MLPLKNELGEKKAKMKTLQTANPADMKAINSLIDDMTVVKTKMSKSRAAMHQEIRKVLTEDQRIKFDMHAGRRGANGHGKGNCNGQGQRHGQK
jgi:Spy/CpxP family protein refolding chaperone